MANKIAEPRADQVGLNDWHDLLGRTTKQGGGFMLLGITNVNTGGRPAITAGSRLEINGVFYEAGPGDEEVSGTPSGTTAADRVNYIYARPSSDTCDFVFSNTAPIWSAAKGGWYDGNNRAVCRFYWLENLYNAKVLLEDFNSFDKVNAAPEAHVQSTNDPLVRVINLSGMNGINPVEIELPPGIYYYQVRGGASGHPGTPGARGNAASGAALGVNGNAGEPRDLGVPVEGTFAHKGGKINAVLGRNGGRGGDGGDGGGANGNNTRSGDGGAAGGGGAGRPSILGSIYSAGGNAKRGGAATDTVISGLTSENSHRGKAGNDGSYGFGGDGGDGGRSVAVAMGEGQTNSGSPGRRGEPPPDSSSGYVRAFRVG